MRGAHAAAALVAGAVLSAAAATPAAGAAQRPGLVRAGARLTRVVSSPQPLRVVVGLRSVARCRVGVRVLAGGRTLARFRVWPGDSVRYSLGRLPPGRYRVTLLTTPVRGCRGSLRVLHVGVAPLLIAPAAQTATPVPGPAAPAIGPTVPPSPASPGGGSVAPPAGGVPAGSSGGANPLAVAPFYVDPGSDAASTRDAWLVAGRTADADQLAKIADRAQAAWFGDWNGTNPAADVSAYVQRAHAAGALALLVAYDIPSRDCGGFSAGGAASGDAYQSWIDGFASGVQAPAVVILEPDALAELDCLDPASQQRALSLLAYATAALGGRPGVSVYLDAGNAGWQPADVIAQRLNAAGVDRIRGFSLNVSNFDWTSAEMRYGDEVAGLIGGSHFVIDTSRNGQGPAADGSWCNPPGRGLGVAPTTATADPAADAYLWIKVPGESDGPCNGGPAAGTWWPDYALALAQSSAP